MKGGLYVLGWKVGLIFFPDFLEVVLVCQFLFPLGRLRFFSVSLVICLIISANSSGGPYRRCSALI